MNSGISVFKSLERTYCGDDGSTDGSDWWRWRWFL